MSQVLKSDVEQKLSSLPTVPGPYRDCVRSALDDAAHVRSDPAAIGLGLLKLSIWCPEFSPKACGQQRLLFERMRFGRTGGGAGRC
jgi:hypothetical protein